MLAWLGQLGSKNFRLHLSKIETDLSDHVIWKVVVCVGGDGEMLIYTLVFKNRRASGFVNWWPFPVPWPKHLFHLTVLNSILL